METWPSTLPQYPLLKGYQEVWPDTRLFTSVEAGKKKYRNRYTAAPVLVTEGYVLTKQQRDEFMSFWRTTTKRGSLEFTKLNPVTETLKIYNFAEGYTPNPLPVSNDTWTLQVQLEFIE